MNTYVFTCGDINGIGPEIAIKAINKIVKEDNEKLILCFPQNVFENIQKYIPLEFDYTVYNDKDKLKDASSKVCIYNIGEANISLGKPTKSSGKSSYVSIKSAYELIELKIADAMITAPISKTAVSMAGIATFGHTEMLAAWSKTKNYVMSFLSENFHTSLLTIHVPLNSVSSILTRKHVKSSLKVIINMMQKDLGIADPKNCFTWCKPARRGKKV